MERQLVVQEAISALQTAVHTHSFLCQCSVPQLKLKLFSTINSHSHRQKTKAIITKVAAPFAKKKVLNDLREGNFI